ncbi:uncharacterized protein BO88DRAFT_54678 [Aspergillus vadensis CBS 113365]|uniref:Uncharacterized protein n=1 Tax=Aspergillus vadensis (strain CBS 113365 / IMI 142717 / IBT 24658) TaxID=1448311 RepID=A0A319BAG6_ASPVC|nr:hypothetical protein BO88DRAFT_54678 [Aspergillus vadensis CBS 113365]PYH68951.1 hypothetical protein BO88DRAFT_54678 [Aspergillus vadensis CBS 113365]
MTSAPGFESVWRLRLTIDGPRCRKMNRTRDNGLMRTATYTWSRIAEQKDRSRVKVEINTKQGEEKFEEATSLDPMDLENAN